MEWEGWVGPIRLIPRRRPQPKERNKKEWESHRLRVILARLPTPIPNRLLRSQATSISAQRCSLSRLPSWILLPSASLWNLLPVLSVRVIHAIVSLSFFSHHYRQILLFFVFIWIFNLFAVESISDEKSFCIQFHNLFYNNCTCKCT